MIPILTNYNKAPIDPAFRITPYRKAAGLRQHEVAQALGLNSIERISKWENGHSIPKGRSLYHLAILYGVSPQQLFGEMYEASSHQISSSTSVAVSEVGIQEEV